jgi:hypothetical protein
MQAPAVAAQLLYCLLKVEWYGHFEWRSEIALGWLGDMAGLFGSKEGGCLIELAVAG